MSDPIPGALAALQARGFGAADMALVLGSGFGAIERDLDARAQVAYADIPGFPPPAGTSGHLCRLSQGTLWGRNTLLFRGRYHAYEGHAPRELGLCVRLAHALGCPLLVVTNAAGGIRDDLRAGEMMAIRDHINLLGINPLTGAERVPGAARFPAMAGAYDALLTGKVIAAAEAAGERVSSGVYAALPGPSFETAAEVEYLRRIGADAVGMSTVPEVITARALGMRVCGLSLITNRAGSIDDSHEGTLKQGTDNAARLGKVLRGLFEAL